MKVIHLTNGSTLKKYINRKLGLTISLLRSYGYGYPLTDIAAMVMVLG